MENEVIGFKAFNKDWKCRNLQYKVGETFEEDVNPELCRKGMHFCKMPLDVLNYYPIDSKFAKVKAIGNTINDGDKSVTNILKVESELSFGEMFKWHFKLLKEKIVPLCEVSAHANTSGNSAHANTSGNSAHANTSGNSAHANTSGYSAHANTSGNEAHANTSGNSAHANTSGYEAHANTSGNSAHANTSGYSAHANTSGNSAHANTSGNSAHANTSGYSAHANTSGNEAHANTSGYEAIASSLGIKSRAKAVKGWIIIVDWYQDNNYNWHIREIYHAKVRQKILDKKIKANYWYWFEDGELKELKG